MADNTQINNGPGDNIRDIDRGTAKTQVVQLDFGGEASESLATAANPLPVTFTSGTVTISGTVAVTQSGVWTTGRTWVLTSGADSVAAVQSGTWTVQQGSAPWSVSQSGTWTVQQGSAPWTFKPDGTVWTLTGTSANVNVTNFPATQTVSGTVTANQGGAWSVAVNNFPATQPISGSVSVSNFPAVQTVTHAGPQPVYLDDQNVPLDDNGYQFVNTNFDGSDVATLSAQLAATTVLSQIAAGAPVSQQGAWTVAISAQPATVLAPNAAAETNGQLQRIADLMEAMLTEMRTLTTVVASLNQAVPEDPTQIRNDLSHSLLN